MDKQTRRPKMVAFFADDPNADEFSCSAPTVDVLCALAAVTATLDSGIGELDIERIQGLAIASRIFSEMLSDRYTSEEVPDRAPKRVISAPEPHNSRAHHSMTRGR